MHFVPSDRQKPASRVPVSSRRSALWALLALSWALPLLVLVLAGWRSWVIDKIEAKERIGTTLRTVEEQVRHVLDTQTLVLDWTQDRIARLTWDEIERSRSLYELLSLLDANYSQIDGIFLVDASGELRLNDHQFPLQRKIFLGDRDYFQALAQGGVPLFVSAPYAGRWNGSRSFRVARPRLTDGRFDGLVALSIHVDYFTRYFKTVIGTTEEAITLMRQDGVILARYPEVGTNAKITDWRTIEQGSAAAIDEVGPVAMSPDGIYRLSGVRPVSGYPVILSYGIDNASLVRRWLANFLLFSSVAAISALILSAITVLAIFGERRERAAVMAWEAEQQQRLRAEADARRLGKYEALGTLAGGVAHHFNNLLPALTGHLEIAIDEAGANSAAAPRLTRLLHEIRGARKIVRDILLYSRRDLSRFRRVDLSVVTTEAAEMFRGSLPPLARLETEIVSGLAVLGEPTQLSELVTNLLRNAADALEGKGGTIMLGLRRRPFHADGSADGTLWAELVCSDTGCGMSTQVVERAFDPFFTTKPPGGGSGLGLAICDGIIRSHDGRISIESAPGLGTRVTALIALATEAGG